MLCRNILGKRGGQVFTIARDDTIAAAAAAMTDRGIGALMVTDGRGGLIGILSERDIARAVARHGPAGPTMAVREFMTADPVVCGLDDHLDQMMAQMSARRIRHLPVMDGGRAVGMVSIRDVIESLLEETTEERDTIRDYVAAATC